MAETIWPPFPRLHFKGICLIGNVWISIKSSLKFVPKGEINNIPATVQITAWRRMRESLLPHIWVTRPQWVKLVRKSHLGEMISQNRKCLLWTSFCPFTTPFFSYSGPSLLSTIARSWPKGTVKPVYNDHLVGYFSAFWSSSRWPMAT